MFCNSFSICFAVRVTPCVLIFANEKLNCQRVEKWNTKKVKSFCKHEMRKKSVFAKSREIWIKFQGIKVRFKTIPSSSIVALSLSLFIRILFYNLLVISLLPCIFLFAATSSDKWMAFLLKQWESKKDDKEIFFSFIFVLLILVTNTSLDTGNFFISPR